MNKEFTQWLCRMIDGCDSIGGMEREKATYQSVLKKYKDLTQQGTALKP